MRHELIERCRGRRPILLEQRGIGRNLHRRERRIHVLPLGKIAGQRHQVLAPIGTTHEQAGQRRPPLVDSARFQLDARERQEQLGIVADGVRAEERAGVLRKPFIEALAGEPRPEGQVVRIDLCRFGEDFQGLAALPLLLERLRHLLQFRRGARHRPGLTDVSLPQEAAEETAP